MVTEITISEGDYGKYIEFTLKESNSIDAHTLSSYDSITFQAQRIGESTVRVSGTCEVTSANDGECRYLIASGDFDVSSPPKWIGIIRAYATGVVVSWEKFYLYIEPSLPYT